VHKRGKQLSRASLTTILVGALILAGTVHFGVVKASTEVTGILSSDVVWTKANSPYSLTGPTLVKDGVTLTIEAGVTVYLNEYDLKVNGTLVARGSSTDKIHFEVSDSQVYYIDRGIEFTSFSANWNEETGSGCIIENAVVSIKLSIGNSPKISNNIINARVNVNGASHVTIANNTITNQIAVGSESSVTISNNNIILETDYSAPIIIAGASAVISNNNITGIGNVGNIGIDFEGGNGVYISDNIISGFRRYGINAAGNSTIERNLIFGNNYGIMIGKGVSLMPMYYGDYSEIIIRNNTIKDNSYGIYGPTSATTIVYNNIQNNSDYNIGIRYDKNITVANNWWGTTDTQTINQTMFDFKKDYNLGTITFIPFLTEPVPEENATPIPEFPSWAVLPLLLTATAVAVFFKKRLATTRNNA
jgi:hypothetical protein